MANPSVKFENAANQTADKSLKYIYQLQKCHQDFRQKNKLFAEEIDSKRKKLAHPSTAHIDTEKKYQELLEDLESAELHFTSDDIRVLREWSLWKPEEERRGEKHETRKSIRPIQEVTASKKIVYRTFNPNIYTSAHSIQAAERDEGTLVTSRTQEYKNANTQTPRQSVKYLYQLVFGKQNFRREHLELYNKIVDLRDETMHPSKEDISTDEKYQELLNDLESAGFFTSENIDKLRKWPLWQQKKRERKRKNKKKNVTKGSSMLHETPSGIVENATADNPNDNGRQ